MKYCEARDLIESIRETYSFNPGYADMNLALIISLLTIKLKAWVPEEYEDFKIVYLKKAFNIEV